MTRGMEAQTVGRRLWPWLGWMLAALGGALLAVLAMLLFYRMDGLTMAAPPVLLHGDKLQLASGQGGPTPAGLEIRQTNPQGWAAVQGVARLAPAALYRLLFWQVEGRPAGSELWLVWTTLADPQTPQQKMLPAAPTSEGVLDLSAEPRWQGRIVAIGLAVRGPLSQPLVIRRLELRPVVPTTGALLRSMVEDWTTFEDWNQRSINYVSGAPLNALFPPVVMAALWVGFSAVLYALFNPPRRTPAAWLPYAALFLLGWLALDLRWQWDLGQRLAQTARDFAGKSEEDRRLAALDGQLYRFVREVRQQLPEQPARLFIISADPAGFGAGRARYHLLPHNGYAGFARLPPPGQAHAGDYVLILTPLLNVDYDTERRVLRGDGAQLPAEMVHFATKGALFRVRGGP